MAVRRILHVYSFLRLERLAQHPVSQYTVCHHREQYLLRQLEEVVLREALSFDGRASWALAFML